MSKTSEEDYDEEDYVKPTIIQVEPTVVENNLFKAMSYQIDTSEKIDVEEKIRELRGVPEKIATIMQYLTKHYFGSMLGGQIIDPMFAKNIVLDRVTQFAEMLMSVYVNSVDEVIDKIEAKKVTGDSFENELNDLLDMIDTSFITLREIMNRFETVVHVNAKPEIRPPLVDAKIGYQKIRH